MTSSRQQKDDEQTAEIKSIKSLIERIAQYA